METDSIIVWVNFIIVLLLLAKFAARPLSDFIKGCKKPASLELSKLEAEKEKISGAIEKTMKSINEKKNLLAETESNIARQAESIKAGIIKEACIESELILEKAKQDAEKDIRLVTGKLRTEVMDEILNKN